jgi:hypothetical protein
MIVLAPRNDCTAPSGGQEDDTYDFDDNDHENVDIKPFKGICQSTSIPL